MFSCCCITEHNGHTFGLFGDNGSAAIDNAFFVYYRIVDHTNMFGFVDRMMILDWLFGLECVRSVFND